MITTNGWGAINAASIDVVNSSITKQKKTPESFSISQKGTLAGMEILCTLSGDKQDKTKPCKWKSWKIIPGGSGELIHISCVVETAYAIVEIEQSNTSTVYDISGSDIKISLNLKAVANASYNLKGKSGKASVIMAEENKDVDLLSSTTINGLDPKKDILIIDLIKNGFEEYFQNHLKDFAAVFAVAMISGKISEDKKQFQWLMPTDISYAFERTNDNKNYFGILTMLDNDKITTQTQQMDTRIFEYMPKDANSVLAISGEKFCKHILLPSAVSIITGSTKEDFEIGKNKISIRNCKQLLWDNFELENGSTIQPTIPAGAFEIKLEGSFIVIEMTGLHYSPSPGVTVTMNMTQMVELKVKKREDGKFVLVTDDKTAFSKNNKISASIETAEWLKIVEIVLDVAACVASLACGALAIGGKIASKFTTTVVEETSAELGIAGEEIAETAQQEAEAASATVGTAAAELASGAAKSTGGFFASNFCKVTKEVCGVVAAAAGLSVGIIEIVKYIESMEYDKIPPLNDFADLLLGNYAWPNLKEAEIVDGTLMDVLLIYTKIPIE